MYLFQRTGVHMLAKEETYIVHIRYSFALELRPKRHDKDEKGEEIGFFLPQVLKIANKKWLFINKSCKSPKN